MGTYTHTRIPPRSDILFSAPERKLLGILSIIAVIALFFATLWPFNFFAKNEVRWLPGENGIEINNPGVVVGRGSLQFAASGSGNSCSIEFILRPASIEDSRTILSVYTPANPRQFHVRRYGDALLISHDVPVGASRPRTLAFDIDHVFQVGTLVRVTIASGPNGTVVYLNGNPARSVPGFRISQSDLAGQFVLGTSAVDYETWAGEIHGLAVYSRALTSAEVRAESNAGFSGREDTQKDLGTAMAQGAVAVYPFNEGSGSEIHSSVPGSAPVLEIPKYFAVPHKAFLKLPAQGYERNYAYALDLAQNIVGFMPLGFILCAYLACSHDRWRATVYATLIGGLLSFTIEVVQYYVPRRDSGVTDIITNTLGTALGALLAGPALIRIVLRGIQWILPGDEVS